MSEEWQWSVMGENDVFGQKFLPSLSKENEVLTILKIPYPWDPGTRKGAG